MADRRLAGPALALAAGWRAEPLVPPSILFGANGIRVGPDGKLYVAESFGNRISAIDLLTHEVAPVCDVGNPIVAPDDMAFDSRGVMYVPDVMSAQVCARSPNGEIRVIAPDMPCANGITVHQDRVFMDECRPQGRLAEIFPDGSRPRILAENLPAPNALAVGPDGNLYFPLVTENEIWRVPVAGGPAERFVGGLAVPTAVKFDAAGCLVTVQAASGEVLRFDLQSGRRTTLARLRPGLDNLDLTSDGRIFVSHYIDGGVEEVLGDGTELSLAPPGMIGPYGLTVASDGAVYACDGLSLVAIAPDGARRAVGHRMDGRFPGWVRGVASDDAGYLLVTTAEGDLARYHPDTHEIERLATGLQEAMEVARASDGTIHVTEAGTGALLSCGREGVRTVARNLQRPMGLAFASGGVAYVAEAAAGRVVAIDAGGATAVIDGLVEPHGVAIDGDSLFVLDVGTRRLVSCNLDGSGLHVVASGLSVGSPPGTKGIVQPGIPQRIPGPLSPYAGLAAGRDGTLYVALNGSGSILTMRRSAPAG